MQFGKRYLLKNPSQFNFGAKGYDYAEPTGVCYDTDAVVICAIVDKNGVAHPAFTAPVAVKRSDVLKKEYWYKYIPLAAYTFGCCSNYGDKTIRRTVEVKADTKHNAWEKAYALLKPSTIETMVHVKTEPNPEHVATIVSSDLYIPNEGDLAAMTAAGFMSARPEVWAVTQ